MVEVVLDELVESDLAEVGLVGGGRPQLLQVHEDQVRVVAGLAV